MSRMAGRSTRVESRGRVRKLVLGLLSDLPRKNCWTIEVPSCSSRSSTGPSSTLSTDFAGPSGDAATGPDPRPATTGVKPLKHEGHGLRL